jgi:hypothetical protein
VSESPPIDPAATEAAPILWAGLAQLLLPASDERHLPCVRVDTSEGGQLDIYRAEQIPRAMPVWRVRGFYRDAAGVAVEQRAVLMGTQDGRAMLVHPPAAEGEAVRPSELVVAAQMTQRDIGDLADVIAAAVRRLVASRDVGN